MDQDNAAPPTPDSVSDEQTPTGSGVADHATMSGPQHVQPAAGGPASSVGDQPTVPGAAPEQGWRSHPGGLPSAAGWDERSRLSSGSPVDPARGPAAGWSPGAGNPGAAPAVGGFYPLPGGGVGVQTTPPAVEATRSGHGRRRTLLTVATVVFAVVGGFAGAAVQGRLTSGAALTGANPSGSLTQSSAPVVSANLAAAPEGSVEQVAATLLPSVVSVLSSSSNSAGEGSGVILSADGLILTNNHVITGSTSLQVQFNDGTTATVAVTGADPTDDLAVIKAAGVSGLTPATLGTSADLKVGQGVVAVGSPLGLSATVTSGIVSALNRPVRTSFDQQQQQTPGTGQGPTNGQTASQATVMNAVQTDAAINPGNSGGPLVDLSGRVIGIDSAIASLSSGSSGQAGSIGVGFAIPIDQAKRIAQEIIDTGHATHAVLGAAVSDATTGTNSLLTTGASIGKVTAGSGADTAGLKAGDVITKVGDQRVDSADALIATIHATAPGSQVTITYTRGNTTDNTATVTLGTATN
jgi:putative serine protease PepD